MKIEKNRNFTVFDLFWVLRTRMVDTVSYYFGPRVYLGENFTVPMLLLISQTKEFEAKQEK